MKHSTNQHVSGIKIVDTIKEKKNSQLIFFFYKKKHFFQFLQQFDVLIKATKLTLTASKRHYLASKLPLLVMTIYMLVNLNLNNINGNLVAMIIQAICCYHSRK